MEPTGTNAEHDERSPERILGTKPQNGIGLHSQLSTGRHVRLETHGRHLRKGQ